MFRQLLSQGTQLGEVAGVPYPGTRHRFRSLAIACQSRHDELADGEERGLGKHPEEMKPRVALQDRPQLVTALQRLQRCPVPVNLDPVDGKRQGAAGNRLPVAHPRIGCHDDPRAGDLAAP